MKENGDVDEGGATTVATVRIDEVRVAALLPAIEKSFKTSVLSIGIFSALLYAQVPTGLSWWLLLRVVTTVGCLIALRRLGASDLAPSDAIRGLGVVMAISGTCWGLLALMLQPSDPEWRAVILLWIFGNQAVITAVCSPSKSVFRAAIGTVTGIGSIAMLVTGDGFGVILAGILLLGGVYSLSIFEAMNATVVNGIERRLMATELARSLDERQAELRSVNATLRDLADHDGLTGLLNRRAMMRELGDGGDHLVAAGWLGMIDIDRFKRVNDTYGHGAGDEVLTELANRWCTALGTEATVARTGGDEFAVFLAHGSQVDVLAASLLDATTTPICVGGVALMCSCSIGFVQVEAGESITTAFSRADAGLYEAKREGRDMVIVDATKAVKSV